MIHPKLFSFFRKLDRNNSKDWFNPRKDEYKEMHTLFAEAMDEMAVEIAGFDQRVERYLDSPKAVKVFRIYKDTRFQKSPVPLKTNISGIVSGGPEGPFYYLQVGPGQTMAGGGIYMPSAPLLLGIREEIAETYPALETILEKPDFKRVYPKALETEFEVKTRPRGFDQDHPAISYLRKKSFTATHEFTDEEAQAPDFYDQVVATFETLEPLNGYLAQGLRRSQA